MGGRQFVGVDFRPGGRVYTYHWDGEPVTLGDLVRVPEKSGDGWKKVRVVEVSWTAPAYATRAILGPHVEEPPAPTLL